MKIPASEIIIRPPVEAYSVLIPVTGGCSWNRCRFCGVYKGIQDYEVRALEDVIESIDFHWAMNPDSKWVFLAGGNATSAPTDFLVEIIKYIKKRFNWVERVSCYSKCLDILKKDDDELKQLAEAGLDIVYMGLESGSKTVLKKMFKGTTDKQIIEVGKRLLK
ncbi:MAG: radical SAM protein, partial [archaeon]|nr:radical SAM protein [archaeon]